eukprot:40655_1
MADKHYIKDLIFESSGIQCHLLIDGFARPNHKHHSIIPKDVRHMVYKYCFFLPVYNTSRDQQTSWIAFCHIIQQPQLKLFTDNAYTKSFKKEFVDPSYFKRPNYPTKYNMYYAKHLDSSDLCLCLQHYIRGIEDDVHIPPPLSEFWSNVVDIYQILIAKAIRFKYNYDLCIVNIIKEYEKYYDLALKKVQRKYIMKLKHLETLSSDLANEKIICNLNHNINEINMNIKVLTQCIYTKFGSKALMDVLAFNKINDVKHKQKKQSIEFHCNRSIKRFKIEYLPNVNITIQRNDSVSGSKRFNVIIELYDEIVPDICAHFRRFAARALRSKTLTFDEVHDWIEIDMDPNCRVGHCFADGKSELSHNVPGLLSAVANTNKFRIVFKENNHLVAKGCAVFGKIIRGWSNIYDIKLVNDHDTPSVVLFKIMSCSLN